MTFLIFSYLALSARLFLNPPEGRHPACPGLPWERSASQTYRLTEDLRRGVEGPRRCLIDESSSGFSRHQNYQNQ